MRSQVWAATLAAVLLLAPLESVAGGQPRGQSLWAMPAVSTGMPLFPPPARATARERGPARRRLSLWDERPAPPRVLALPPPSRVAAYRPAATPVAWTLPFSRPTPWRAAAAAIPYRALAERHAARFGLPVALVLAVIATESSFNPVARSLKNAQGLMQLVPDKGGVEALRAVSGNPWTPPPTPDQLADPDFNILLGTAYLRLVLDQLPGNLPWEVRRDLALAAYNWGPERVARRLVGASPPATLAEARARLDRFAPAETRNYVRRVIDRLAHYGGDGWALEAVGWRSRLAQE